MIKHMPVDALLHYLEISLLLVGSQQLGYMLRLALPQDGPIAWDGGHSNLS